MNELEATRAKLKCLEMVEGTGLDWWNVVKIRIKSYVDNTSVSCFIPTFNFDFEYYENATYEFALGVVEGKPVWNGDRLYDSTGCVFTAKTIEDGRMHGYITPNIVRVMPIELVSWNPPKPKNEKADKLRELLTIQKQSCDCINDNYFRGMYNGMDVMLACVEDRDADFIPAPTPKTIMVELPIDVVKSLSKGDGTSLNGYNTLIHACRKAIKELK